MEAKDNPYKKFPTKLSFRIEGDNHKYDYYGMLPARFYYYDDPTTTLSVNGFTYTKVHILDRSNILSHHGGIHDGCCGSMFNEAKYTYYDEDYGIIGFDDYDGNQWRLEK
jgi:hypothetical protein